MKTKLSQILLLFIITMLMSCDDKNNESSQLSDQLNRYDVKGYFLTNHDMLKVMVPVTNNGVEIIDAINISTNKVNAVLIRVDDKDSDLCTKLSPVVNVKEKTFSLKGKGFNLANLKAHKKLKVIVINSDGTNLSYFIDYYKECLATNPVYKKETCRNQNICIENKTDPDKSEIKRPNEDGGDIIVGG